MPHYLNDLGYRTAFVGKTHFKPKSSFPFEFLDAVAVGMAGAQFPVQSYFDDVTVRGPIPPKLN